MVTRVSLEKFLMTLFDWPIPKTPSFVKMLGLILNASLVIVIFVWEFPNFRCHGNRGWSDTNFSLTVKSVDPQNPLFGARILMISHTQAVL